MKLCKKIQPLLVLFSENELSMDEKTRVETHLNTCPNCRQELKKITSLKELMTAEEHSLSVSYSSELVHNIHEKLDQNKNFRFRLVPAVSFASIILVLALSLVLNHGTTNVESIFSEEYLLYKQYSGTTFLDDALIYEETEEMAQDLMPEDYIRSTQEYLLENSDNYSEVISQLDEDAFDDIIQNLKNMEI